MKKAIKIVGYLMVVAALAIILLSVFEIIETNLNLYPAMFILIVIGTILSGNILDLFLELAFVFVYFIPGIETIHAYTIWAILIIVGLFVFAIHLSIKAKKH